ncbi:MAG: hypothetical protein ACHQ49_00775 [Elusimicrobiota bacterium]
MTPGTFEAPILTFDLRAMEQRMRAVAALAARSNFQILFPVKSFPARPALRVAARCLHGFDVSNRAELDLIRPFLSRRHALWVSGPAPADARSFPARATIGLDNPGARPIRGGVRAAVRIDASELLPSRGESRFGWSFEQISGLKGGRGDPLSFSLHHGFQNTTAADVVSLFILSTRRLAQLGFSYHEINLGGGWQHMGMRDVSWMFRELRARGARGVVFEPGRWFSQHCGAARGRILAARRSRRGWDLTLNVSALAHLRWSKTALAGRVAGIKSGRERLRFFGPSCSEDDLVLTAEGAIPDPASVVGAAVRLRGVCGYSAAWNHSFNGFPAARVRFEEPPGRSRS